MNAKYNIAKVFPIIAVLAMIFSSIQPPAAQAQGGDGLQRQVNAESGRVSFISPASGRSLSAARALGPQAIRSQDLAMALANRYAPEFGLRDSERSLTAMESNRSEAGHITARFQQNYQDVPVMGGELIVNTNDDGDLYSISGEVSPGLSLSTQPTISAEQARQTALGALAKWYEKTPEDFTSTAPELWIYDESLLQPSTRSVELTWRMEVTPKDQGMPVRELVLVNAQRGNVSLHFNQVDMGWSASGVSSSLQQDTPPTATPEPTETPVVSETPEPLPTALPVIEDAESLQAEGQTIESAELSGNLYVANTGNDSNSCDVPASPCATINATIGKATSGAMIKVAQGTYITTNYQNPVVRLDKNITLSGGWDVTFSTRIGLSTIDGQNQRRVIVNYQDITSNLEYFILTNGQGSGIYNAGNLTITDSSIQNSSSSGFGGAIENHGNLTIAGSTIQNNSAPIWGGGIYNNEYGTLTITNTTIKNNTVYSGNGGGIYNNGTLTVANSFIEMNTASSGWGGGIYTRDGIVTINDTAVIGNKASYGGGGMSVYSGAGSVSPTVTLNNTTISGNASSSSGGGISNSLGAKLVLNNSTLSNNTANSSPGGIKNDGSANLKNTILGGNTANTSASDCSGSLTSNGNNIISTTSGCTITASSGDKFNTNPGLGTFLPILGYHPILPSSPAVNAGNPATCLPKDQRGMARVGTCDVGAYEYTVPGSPARLVIVSGDGQRTPPNSTFPKPFQTAVLDGNGSPVPNINITFSAPGIGASGNFAGTGTNTTQILSDASGIATTSVFGANNENGSYSVTASAGALASVNFSLQNVVLYVSTTGNDSNSCTIPAAPCATIGGALNKASDDDTIYVGTGTYTGGSPNSPIVKITRPLTLSGGWNNAFNTQTGFSVIDGNSAKAVGVAANAANVFISRFIVKNASSGIENGGTLTFSQGALINNNNGIYNYSGNTTFTNVTISGNHSNGKAGSAISNTQGTVNIRYSTITNNSGVGSAIYNANGGAYIKMESSILAGNVDGDCQIYSNPAISEGFNIFGSSPACAGSTIVLLSSDQAGADPKLLTLSPAGYHPILGNSPAFNKGNPLTCPASDQRAKARPGGASCDAGAFEIQSNGVTPAYITAFSGSQSVIPGGTASSNLKAMVQDANGDAISGQTVTFTAPAGGSTVIFAGTGTNVAAAITGADGLAVSPGFSTSPIPGSFFIQATVSGLAEAGYFHILNSNALVKTYTANNDTQLPGTLLCDQNAFNCTNGVKPQVDAAHQFAIETYSLYQEQYGRNSIDNAGMIITSSVHYKNGYDNAYWSGTQMVFGDAHGFALADDVVAHELTHGVTQYESNLFYYYQSGAINESFSDLWGEYFDQTNGQGNDTPGVKWLIGEDVTGLGAQRSMINPPAYGDPDKMTSPNYQLRPYYDDNWDDGGVHTNSGVNNKAVYLMVDGGTFNYETVTGLGWDKVAAIYYEANTNLLTSGADYSDLYYALQQACTNLIGQKGIAAEDCVQVKNAADAVEMNKQPIAGSSPDAPLCTAAGVPPNIYFADDLEDGPYRWWFTKSPSDPYLRWQMDTPVAPYAQSGNRALFANDYPVAVTDASAVLPSIAVPPNAYLWFAQAYEFDYGTENYDGGVLEYSTNGGSTWVDAGPLMDINGYNGVLSSKWANPLKGRHAFVASSRGYMSTRLNLSSLAGKNIYFRWRMGLDQYDYAMGWWVDNIKVYTCGKGPTFADVPNTHPYYNDIEILYANGLTGGCSTSPMKFCPDQIMDRAQASVFMMRGTYGSGYSPNPTANLFQDSWTPGTWARPWVEAMRETGLTTGCQLTPWMYCPWKQLPREQVVIFGLKMKYGNGYLPPAATGTVFADMTDPNYYATSWAEQAYADGLITSCGTLNGKPKFCPATLVTRGMGAYVIVRAKNLTMP